MSLPRPLKYVLGFIVFHVTGFTPLSLKFETCDEAPSGIVASARL